MNTTELNVNKTLMDISRDFDVPFNQVLSDLEKLQELLEGGDIIQELIYYYKCDRFGMN